MAAASVLSPCITTCYVSSATVSESVCSWVNPSTPIIHSFTYPCKSWSGGHIPSVYSLASAPPAAASLANVEISSSLDTLWQEHPLREDFVHPSVLVSVLRDCRTLDAAEEALSIVVQSGFDSDTYVGTNLIQLYGRLKNLPEACRMFNKVEEPNVITWTSVISAHLKLGEEEQGIELYHKMRESGIEPDGYAVVSALDACAHITSLEEGMQVHDYIVKSGLDSSIYVGNALISMYVSCGNLEEASAVFSQSQSQDVITWSTLVGGYAQHGHEQEVFRLIVQMHRHGVEPNIVTYIHVLQSCADNNNMLKQGMLVHACIIENGFDGDELVGSALIDMYGKCGLLEDACKVFDGLVSRDTVTWTSLIAAFSQEVEGYAQIALQLYGCTQLEGVRPNNVMYLSVLKACAILSDLDYGREVHHRVVASGWDGDVVVSSSVIDMYMKCGMTEDAFRVFDKLSKRNVVTWSSLIVGHVELGFGDVALELFHQMQEEGVEPDLTCLVCILKACTCVAALEHGKIFHGDIIKRGFDMDEHVGSILICMYASCGSLADAVAVFERIDSRNVVVFNALITGYAKNNKFTLALDTFSAMKRCECKPDGVTFLSLLIACSNLNLVKEGCHLFMSMREHGKLPELHHYNTMVDIFGHAGLLSDSEDMLETMPFKANTVGWVSLLSSCRTFRDIVVGRRCFERVVTIEPQNSSAYVLMSKIYALLGLHESANRLEQLRLLLKAWKVPGRSYIEVDRQVHRFTVGERGLSKSEEIYGRLGEVIQRWKRGGSPQHPVVKPVIVMEDGEMCGHSEMLAVGFGLVSTPQGRTLRITKNLWTCSDCHSLMMFTSKIEKRRIILVDAYCVHEFRDGMCTCSNQSYEHTTYR